jgi:hypothetical protein
MFSLLLLCIGFVCAAVNRIQPYAQLAFPAVEVKKAAKAMSTGSAILMDRTIKSLTKQAV